jgi:hypothetical protein
MRMVSLIVAVLMVTPALAEECGNPPELPDLPASPAQASEEIATQVVQSDHDFARDIEGYLVCLQLAESDANDAERRGAMRPVEAGVMIEKYRHQAADARGRQSHWTDLYDNWARAWTRAHHKGMPTLPPE